MQCRRGTQETEKRLLRRNLNDIEILLFLWQFEKNRIIDAYPLWLFPHHLTMAVLGRRAELFPPLLQDHKKSSSTCKKGRRGVENTSLFNHHWRRKEEKALISSKVRHFIFTAVLNKVCFAFELESSQTVRWAQRTEDACLQAPHTLESREARYKCISGKNCCWKRIGWVLTLVQVAQLNETYLAFLWKNSNLFSLPMAVAPSWPLATEELIFILSPCSV